MLAADGQSTLTCIHEKTKGMRPMIKVKIEGMTCQHCVRAVKEALAEVPGVTNIEDIDLETGMASIEGDAELDTLIAAVKDAGYTASQG